LLKKLMPEKEIRKKNDTGKGNIQETEEAEEKKRKKKQK